MSRAWNSMGLKAPVHLLLLVWVLLVGGSSVVFAIPSTVTNSSCTNIASCTGCLPTYVGNAKDGRNLMLNTTVFYSTCQADAPNSPSGNCCTTDLVQVYITSRVVAVAYWNTPTNCTGQPDGSTNVNMIVKQLGCTGNASSS